MSDKRFTVKKDENGLALDKIICTRMPDLSRRNIRKLIDLGSVLVNGKKLTIATRKLQLGDTIIVKTELLQSLTNAKAKKKDEIKLHSEDILYLKDEIVAINKPPHILSAPTKNPLSIHAQQLLIEWIMNHKKSSESNEEAKEPILCHRLDKETSGILLFALSKHRADELMQGFKQRTIKKTYLALVHGLPKKQEWQTKNFLSPIHKKTGLVKTVLSGGKTAMTQFKVLHKFSKQNLSLIECRPETGRSHQIRVHLADAGYPIVSDKKYCNKSGMFMPSHHLLHAYKIVFALASGKNIEIKASLPKEFAEIMKKLGYLIKD